MKKIKKECEHLHYEIKKVMDMTFCACKECGFQWKGDKPFK